MSLQTVKSPEITIILNSSDEVCLTVSLHEAKISNLVKNIIEEEEDGNSDSDEVNRKASNTIKINLPNVESTILREIIKFMKHHHVEPLEAISYPFKGSTLSDVVTQEWYISFISSMESKTLFKVINGANYMDIEPLFNLGCLVTSTMIMDKTPEEIRVLLNIDKLSGTEELQAREDYEWIFS